MRISDWSSDVCSSDLLLISRARARRAGSSSGVRLMRYSIGLRRGAPLFEAFDLFEVEFDRGGAAEDRHRHLDARLFEIELLDQPVEAGEGTVEHLDLIADFIIDADFGLRTRRGLFLAVEDARGFGFADRQIGRASCRVRVWQYE